MKFGAHVSAAGGIDKAIDRASAMGAQCIQIFGSPPQSFNPPNHTLESIACFKLKASEANVTPVFLHGVYLINLATPNPDALVRSIDSLTRALALSEQLGAVGVIFHTGSSLGASFEDVSSRVSKSIAQVLEAVPGPTKLIIENSAGMGGSIGSKMSEIGKIINLVGSDRVAMCLDTQHAFAAGWDLTTPAGIDSLIVEIGREVGLERLVAVHANDSKIPLGGGKDRHENIGRGEIGENGFKLMKANEVLNKLPWVIEVPGLEDKGPDQANLDLLKSL